MLPAPRNADVDFLEGLDGFGRQRKSTSATEQVKMSEVKVRAPVSRVVGFQGEWDVVVFFLMML